MCTQAEVREVIKETVTPVWAKRLLGAGILLAILFLGWLSYETHMQDQARLEQDASVSKQLNEMRKEQAKGNSDLCSKIDNIRFIFATSVAEATSKVDRLALELDHVKELALSRSGDRYTGRDATARNNLVDERYKARDEQIIARKEVVDRRLKEIEDAIQKQHKIK